MIFAFEVTKLDAANRPPEVTMQYYTRCVEALHRHSPNVPVIVLIQKMDLVHPDRRDADFNAWIEAIKEYSADTPFTAFGTSIYEDTLYRVRPRMLLTLSLSYLRKLTTLKAWSAVVQNLVPNIDDLTKSLNIFSKSCGAVETVIFEKTTFLLVARSAVEEPRNESLVAVYAGSQQEHVEEAVIQAPTEEDHDSLQPEVNRFEKIIKLIKSFQISTRNYSAEPFEALRMDISTFTLVLDQLTPTSYVLVIASSNEPRISAYSFWILWNTPLSFPSQVQKRSHITSIAYAHILSPFKVRVNDVGRFILSS